MEIANSSLLDEATAAAEAMTLAKRSSKNKSNVLLVAGDCHPQTIEVVKTRAEPLGIAVKVGFVPELMKGDDYFGVLAQYPSTTGLIHDMRAGSSGAWQRRIVLRRKRSACADTARGAGDVGRRHRRQQFAAFRCAVRFRWPARRISCLQGRVQALDAGTVGRSVDRFARPACLPADFADARTAYSPRKGDVEYLHRASAAGSDGQHVRRLSRTGRFDAYRAPRASADRHPRRRLEARGAERQR